MKYVSLFACALAASAAVGCGAGTTADKPALVRVEGRLVNRSGAPVADAQVEFQPSRGAPSAATTDGDGRFVLNYVDGSKGAIAGEHQVRITVGSSRMGDGTDTRPTPSLRPPTLYVLPQVNVEKETDRLELTLPDRGQVG